MITSLLRRENDCICFHMIQLCIDFMVSSFANMFNGVINDGETFSTSKAVK